MTRIYTAICTISDRFFAEFDPKGHSIEKFIPNGVERENIEMRKETRL